MIWQTLLETAEQVHPQIAGVALRHAGPAKVSELLSSGALIRIAEPAVITQSASWDSDADAFEHGYDPSGIELSGTHVKVVPPTHDPCTYRLSLDWLLRSVATGLDISRAAHPAEMISKTLWRLGVGAAADREPTFFLACRLYWGNNLANVLAELSAILHREPLIVLTTAQGQPGVAVPAGIRLVSLHQCAWLDGAGISFDHAFIADVGRGAFSTWEIRGEFWHSRTYDVVRLRGVEFRLGPIRREVVRKLHEASKTDQPWVPGKSLLPDPTKRMVDTFKTLKPDWRLLIESDGRGNYRLKLQSAAAPPSAAPV